MCTVFTALVLISQTVWGVDSTEEFYTIYSEVSPYLRLQNDASGQADWLLATNGACSECFGIYWQEDGDLFATPSFVIENGAPWKSLRIKSDGKVGLGTDAPSGDLEVAKYGQNVLVVVNRTDGARCGFMAKTNQFFIGTTTAHPVVIAAGNSWVTKFNTDGSLTMANGATCTSSGVWTDYCSRDAKENIRSLTAEEALDTLGGLNPVRYNYKVDKEDDCVGFIAEDVPDLVATKERKGMSPMDIVAVLTKVVQEQQKVIQGQQELFQEQQKTISELNKRVAEVESKQ